MKEYEILVVGSLAFDVMFSVPNDFRQSIPLNNGEIKHFNATYIADRKKEYPGGTAGNVAAWLGQEQVGVSLFSAWGKDLESKGYQAKLETLGHELKGDVGEFTAHCYNVSDPIHQQLVIWQPNHYEANQTQTLSEHYSEAALKQFKYALFAAGTPNSICQHIKELRAVNSSVYIVFDPGEVSPFFTEEQFKQCVELSDLVIGNQVEAEHFERYMQAFWPTNPTRVTTLGAKGFTYKEPNDKAFTTLAAPRVEKVVETTGAGDAFRAGLLYGLQKGWPLAEALQKGADLGAQSVQLPQPQPV